MNKELLKQLSTDEQQVAAEINSAAEAMKPSLGFQWELETRLMDAANQKTRHASPWQKIMPSLGWVLVAGCVLFLLNWTIRSLASNPPEVGAGIPDPQVSFLSDVRQGDICTGTLALGHGFSVFLTSPDKTGFVMLDEQKTIGELRSFAWSPDGRQLAIVGNTTGQGNIYLTNSTGNPLQPVLANSELGYLMGTSWSQDGKLLVTWSVQNNKVVYLLNVNGMGFVERELPVQIFETPQFTPGHESITFYGADSALGDGLFQTMLNSSRTTDSPQTIMISDLVEDESSFAWSPDGLRRAYIEMDRNLGEARLVVEERINGRKVVLGTLPIPKGSGSSIPEATNLNWSPDGKSIVFDVGRGANDRIIYLARMDATELVQVVEAGYAPAISSDGKCLAYINSKQLFLLDLAAVSNSLITTPVLLADLPEGRGAPNYQLDKLQWQP